MVQALIVFYVLGMLLMFAYTVNTGKPKSKKAIAIFVALWWSFGFFMGVFAIIESIRKSKKVS